MRSFYLLFIGLLFFGCKESPLNVYLKAQRAAEEKNFDKFIENFTANSRKVLKNIKRFNKIIKDKDIKYLNNIFEVLPRFKNPDKLKVKIDGNRAIVTDGKKRNPKEIIFLREGGKWKIVVFELPLFFKEIK